MDDQKADDRKANDNNTGNQNLVRENFGRRAENYRYSSVHNNAAELERMIELLKPDRQDRALDVATGAGHTAHKLAEHVREVVAIDITREMLAEAKAGAKEKGLENIEFRPADVHQIDLPDESFDIVASRFAAHHFARIEKALSEMGRALKPGGKLYILDCSTVDGDEAEEKLNRIELIRDSSHVCAYSPRRWKEMLQKLPLAVDYFRLWEAGYDLPQWFDRTETPEQDRARIFAVLNSLSPECRKDYPFSPEFIMSYRVEILAHKD